MNYEMFHLFEVSEGRNEALICVIDTHICLVYLFTFFIHEFYVSDVITYVQI